MDYLRNQKLKMRDLAPWRLLPIVVPAIYVASAVAFLWDLYRQGHSAYGAVYALLIATSVMHRQKRGLWILTAVTCILVAVGAAFPIVAQAWPDSVGDRIMTVLALITTACFIHRDHLVRDRLTAATKRAEAAERMKTDVLTNLGREIPPSFHALLGVLSLTMATSGPEQRAALGRVRTDGRKLLGIIENLLDLTQIDEHQLICQPFDLGSIARDAAERVRATAGERQIGVALILEDDSTPAAIGDPWAMRRIMDNLLDNAVRLTPPGGTVSVSIGREADMITASVSDTGNGLPPGVTADFQRGDGDGEALKDAGATGLVLSKRLARAMNGRLTARNGPIRGAIVSLSLPAA